MSASETTQITRDPNPSSQVYYVPFLSRGAGDVGGDVGVEGGGEEGGEKQEEQVKYSTLARDLVIDVLKGYNELFILNI